MLPKAVRHDTFQGMDSIEVTGPFNFNDPSIDHLVSSLVASGRKALVFNLEKTFYITSSAMALMIKAYKKLRAVNGTLYIAHTTPDMRTVFECTGMDRYVTFL